MPWVKSDDGEALHSKMLSVSVGAFGFHQAAKQWSSRNLTDGFIPLSALGPVIYHDVTREAAVAFVEQLALANDPSRPDSSPLWKKVEGGWLLHDFLKYNPARRRILAKRKAAQDRKKKWIRHRKRNANGTLAEREGNAPGAQPGTPLPVPVSRTRTPEALTPRIKVSRAARSILSTPGFEAFYQAYPRHIGRDDATKAWRQMDCEPIADAVLAGLHRNLPDLISGGTKYTPYPATWLRAGRWKDEPTPTLDPLIAANMQASHDFVTLVQERRP